MKGLNFRVSGDLTNTDYVMENTFWIGLYPGLTSQHLEYVVSKLKFYFQK
jgi:CDP-6-deoxy-D-xylo-4-hexulose-3-dehydrase